MAKKKQKRQSILDCLFDEYRSDKFLLNRVKEEFEKSTIFFVLDQYYYDGNIREFLRWKRKGSMQNVYESILEKHRRRVINGTSGGAHEKHVYDSLSKPFIVRLFTTLEGRRLLKKKYGIDSDKSFGFEALRKYYRRGSIRPFEIHLIKGNNESELLYRLPCFKKPDHYERVETTIKELMSLASLNGQLVKVGNLKDVNSEDWKDGMVSVRVGSRHGVPIMEFKNCIVSKEGVIDSNVEFFKSCDIRFLKENSNEDND